MSTVFFYEAFREEAKVLERLLPSWVTAAFTSGTVQESGHTHPPAPVISIRTQSDIPPPWAKQLQAVMARSTGYDLPKAYRSTHNPDLACGYLPSYAARSVAEHAILLAMALLRRLPAQTRQFPAFDRDGLTGTACAGKTLLVVGVGGIGYEVVRIARGLGMDAIGVDIVRRHEDVRYVSKHEGIRHADVIVCAMNLTAESRGYFSYELLARAERKPVFVNVARGELAPSEGLLRVIEDDRLAGVGLDVYDQETELANALRKGEGLKTDAFRATMELARKPNVIMTPHNAFNTHEALEEKCKRTCEQLCHFFRNGRFLWPVP